MQAPHVSHPSGNSPHRSRPEHPILDLPLTAVIRKEYALPLQHVLKLYTVGNLLGAWRDADIQRSIEEVFDTAEQAHHAIATFAAWVGFQSVAAPRPVDAWWHHEDVA